MPPRFFSKSLTALLISFLLLLTPQLASATEGLTSKRSQVVRLAKANLHQAISAALAPLRDDLKDETAEIIIEFPLGIKGHVIGAPKITVSGISKPVAAKCVAALEAAFLKLRSGHENEKKMANAVQPIILRASRQK